MNKLATSIILLDVLHRTYTAEVLQLNISDKCTGVAVKCIASLGLREEVSFLIARVHVENVQGTSHDLFAKPVELHVDMLGAGMMDRIVGQCSS